MSKKRLSKLVRKRQRLVNLDKSNKVNPNHLSDRNFPTAEVPKKRKRGLPTGSQKQKETGRVQHDNALLRHLSRITRRPLLIFKN